MPSHSRTIPITVLLRLSAVVTLALLLGCATKLKLEPANIERFARPEPVHVLVAEAKGTATTGHSGPLSAGTQFQPIGRIQQGLVLRPMNKELAVQGEDREEAYVVVRGTMWVGYYLPFEKAFVGLSQPVTIRLE